MTAQIRNLEEARRAIDSHVHLVLELFGRASGIDFGLNRASLRWLDDLIELQRAAPGFDPEPVVESLTSLIGSFLGACIVADTKGDWHINEKGSLGVRLPNGVFVNPFQQTKEAIRRGVESGATISRFHQAAVGRVAIGGEE
ncbi:hypothetical protein [Nocardia sp. NPDC056564]